MNSTEFERLPKEKKCRYVWTHCAFIATRFHAAADRKFRVNLFYNGSFFVEVWYNSQYDYFGDIISFDDRKMLEPYIDLVNLNELLVH